MPKVEFLSSARPSQFAYVPPLEEKKDKKGEKVETAVLSITAKAKKKEAEKKKDKEGKEKGEETMEVVWNTIFFLYSEYTVHSFAQ